MKHIARLTGRKSAIFIACMANMWSAGTHAQTSAGTFSKEHCEGLANLTLKTAHITRAQWRRAGELCLY